MHVSVIGDPLRGLGGSHAESRPERVSSTGLWPCQARRQENNRANGKVGFEVVVGRARWVGFIGGSFVFFAGFFFLLLRLLLLLLYYLCFVNSFTSSRYFFCWSVFCLECCLFLRLDWVLLSLFYCGDLCAFRSTSCCLLNGFDLLSTFHIPYSQFFL